jgi:hypothetical protein
VWILRTISTKKIVSKGNNNDGECHCLWIHLYRPRGVCATWFDCVYIYRVKEASTGSAPVSALRLSIRIRPKRNITSSADSIFWLETIPRRPVGAPLVFADPTFVSPFPWLSLC